LRSPCEGSCGVGSGPMYTSDVNTKVLMMAQRGNAAPNAPVALPSAAAGVPGAQPFVPAPMDCPECEDKTCHGGLVSKQTGTRVVTRRCKYTRTVPVTTEETVMDTKYRTKTRQVPYTVNKTIQVPVQKTRQVTKYRKVPKVSTYQCMQPEQYTEDVVRNFTVQVPETKTVYSTIQVPTTEVVTKNCTVQVPTYTAQCNGGGAALATAAAPPITNCAPCNPGIGMTSAPVAAPSNFLSRTF